MKERFIRHCNSKVLIENALQLATRISKKSSLTKLIGKIKSCKRKLELQSNQNRKIEEGVTGLGKNLNTSSLNCSVQNLLLQITSLLLQL